MILEPRFKCELLKQELEEKAASFLIAQSRDFLHRHYFPEEEPQSPLHLPSSHETYPSTELRLLQKLQGLSRYVSDIDRYFDDGIIMRLLTKEFL
ncbi:hypothetical protein V1515DRAFT_268082 [Lipomyces mesembrius]